MGENQALIGTLRGFTARGALPHALILSGPGAAEAAPYVAAAMLCTAADKPCLTCPQCRKALSGIHPDVLLATDDEHKELSAEFVRDLRREMHIMPNEGARKIAVFPRIDQVNDKAQNILLKVIEEGPPYAAFLFCADTASSLLPTVRSRCVELKLLADDQAPEVDEALLNAFASGKKEPVLRTLVALEEGRLTREQLHRRLEGLWRVSARALALSMGGAATEDGVTRWALPLSRNLTKQQLNGLVLLSERFSRETEFNVGVGHVLGAMAAEWEKFV